MFKTNCKTKVVQADQAKEPYANRVKKSKYGNERNQIGQYASDWLDHIGSSVGNCLENIIKFALI
jgi:hypothetical protein